MDGWLGNENGRRTSTWKYLPNIDNELQSRKNWVKNNDTLQFCEVPWAYSKLTAYEGNELWNVWMGKKIEEIRHLIILTA